MSKAYPRATSKLNLFIKEAGATPEVEIRSWPSYATMRVSFGGNEVTWFVDLDTEAEQTIDELVGSLAKALSTISFKNPED